MSKRTDWRALGRLILLTGTRRGEAYWALWRDVDLDAKLWHIPAEVRKGRARGSLGERQPLDVPLSPLAVEVLEELAAARGRTGRLFGGGVGIVGGEIKRATGLDVTIHDLRRTTASGLQRIGAPPHIISIVLGHNREAGAAKTDAAYTHDRREGEHRHWLERWAQHVRALMRGEKKGTVTTFPTVAG